MSMIKIFPFFRCIITLIFVGLGFNAVYANNLADKSTWEIYDVEDLPSNMSISNRNIYIDSSNNPHIIYGGDKLRSAYYDGSKWKYEILDTYLSISPSTTMDSSGNAHISYLYYYKENNEWKVALKYTTNESGKWETTTIESYRTSYYDYDTAYDETRGFTSITHDSKNRIHISYYDNEDGDVKYATNASGTWEINTVDNIGRYSGYISIAVDSSGHVHISYYDSSNGDLKYATNTSGTWVATTVDSEGSVGKYTSIAVDSSGYVHISYHDSSNSDLKYATNTSGTWKTYIIDKFVDFDYYIGCSSIALDSKDNVHISYWDGSAFKLKYATNASGTWETTTVDDSASHASITLDSSDNVHIGHYGYPGYDLVYATNTSGTWKTTTVDSEGYPGAYTSIAVDRSGHVHFSYYNYIDSSNGDLKYATNISGTWVATTVDSGAVGKYTSIAMDSSGHVHISYYDASHGSLKYAKGTSKIPTSTGSEIYGTVIDTKGGQITSVDLSCKGENSNKIKRTKSDKNGYFKFSNLYADIYKITAKKRNYKRAKKVIELEESEEKEIKIIMEKRKGR